VTNQLFSDREFGQKPRKEQEIPPNVWGGIVAVIEPLVETGAFGIDFPKQCSDGQGPVGTDRRAFELVLLCHKMLAFSPPL
jgi:hypothetical protein